MARPRNTRSRAPQATSVLDPTVNTPPANNGNSNQGERKIMGLTAEQVTALLAGTRQKGQYNKLLTRFIESGEAGISVSDEFPELAEKKDATVAQGFENAKKSKDAPAEWEAVKVIKNEGQVYLINPNAGEAVVTTETDTE